MRLSDQHAAAAEGLRKLELAALPTGKEWAEWWRFHWRQMEMKFGWERAIVDAVTRLIRNQLTLARMIRNTGAGKMVVKYDSDGHVHDEGTRWPDEITREALAWFINVINPTKRDAPAWAQQLFKAVEGCYIQQARLGIELSAVRRKGYLTLNASATKRIPSDREIRDKGMAAFGDFDVSDMETL